MEKIRQSEEKYFEKKRLAVEREKQEALEQEMYEFEMEKKRLRVNVSTLYCNIAGIFHVSTTTTTTDSLIVMTCCLR